MTSDRDKVLNFLKLSGGKTNKTKIFIDVFSSCRSQKDLKRLLDSDLAGLVKVRREKNREFWELTPDGHATLNRTANQDAPEIAQTQTEAIKTADEWDHSESSWQSQAD